MAQLRATLDEKSMDVSHGSRCMVLATSTIFLPLSLCCFLSHMRILISLHISETLISSSFLPVFMSMFPFTIHFPILLSSLLSTIFLSILLPSCFLILCLGHYLHVLKYMLRIGEEIFLFSSSFL